ncbi:MAG TPA: ATP-dependent Clp protease adaptor ClpS [Elusimicrobiota bacterium]|nr:ATP-dependent Clp protease adaptor ClpS [Elusimicrobiota bacterium]
MRNAALPRAVETPSSGTGAAFYCKTILFNCDCHTFDDVATQLMRAIRCTYTRGLQLANVVHHTGSAVVYSGPRERCEAVAAVLEDIGLSVLVSE